MLKFSITEITSIEIAFHFSWENQKPLRICQESFINLRLVLAILSPEVTFIDKIVGFQLYYVKNKVTMVVLHDFARREVCFSPSLGGRQGL